MVKKLGFFSIFLSPIVILSSSNLMIMWVFLELSSCGFLSILLMEKMKESFIDYLITQVMSSVMILLQFYTKLMNMLNGVNFLTVAILIKLGMFPFHWWMMKMFKDLKWFYIILISTIQKVAPLVMIGITSFSFLLIFSVILSNMFGSSYQLFTSSVKIIMSLSAIQNTGWLTLSAVMSLSLSLYVFFIYFFVSSTLMIMFSKVSMFFIQDIKNTKTMVMFIMMMFLAGIPPFPMFLTKILIIKMLLSFLTNPLIYVNLMMASIISVFSYFRFLNMVSKNFKFSSYLNLSKFLIVLLMFSSLVFMFVGV